jgi:enoyl-CoA hydratase/carnithine racemase
METAMEVAKKLLANSPLVVQGWKRALHINADARLSDQYDVEFAFSGDLLDTHDYEEAMSAFLEKRKPVYTGK